MNWTSDLADLYCGDALDLLRGMPDQSVQCCVTSPPYWGLRDYGTAGQLGLEKTPKEYVARMVAVFHEVRRVLRDDGTLWLNMGDGYAANRSYQVPSTKGGPKHSPAQGQSSNNTVPLGLKPKDLIGMPWRLAFALQADGWYLRSDIIWAKPNPMPESVTDRPTKAHEYVFLLTKSARYFYDNVAVRDPSAGQNGAAANFARTTKDHVIPRQSVPQHRLERVPTTDNGARNLRTVWHIATQPYKGAHFATFPRKLVEPCIKAGTRPNDVVLDPFAGSGTVLQVAQDLGRQAVGFELNPAYCDLAAVRANLKKNY